MIYIENEYQVKTPVFEGPLELLLSLVEERKLFINEISLGEVADDFLNYLQKINEFKIAEVSSFVAVAATLILIKSKSLLPNIDLSSEEEKEIVDLESRLHLYQIVKKLTVFLKENFAQNIIFSKEEKNYFEPVFSPHKISLEVIQNSMVNVLANLPKKEFLPEVSVTKSIKIEEIIDNLMTRVTNCLKMKFGDLSLQDSSDAKEKKVYAIVSFLAILELAKQGLLIVNQENNYEEIYLEKCSL